MTQSEFIISLANKLHVKDAYCDIAGQLIHAEKMLRIIDDLLYADSALAALEEAGVDNWEGYEEAINKVSTL